MALMTLMTLSNSGNLISGNSTSCGHNSNKDKLKDLEGQQFGELTVHEYKKTRKEMVV